MSLKSKEVKSAGGGVSSDFIEMLYDPTVTSAELDEYARSPEGKSYLMSIVAMPKDILDDDAIVTRLSNSLDLLEVVFSNYQLGVSIINHESAVAIIFANTDSLRLFTESSVHKTMLADSALITLVTNMDYLRYAAEHDEILTAIFSSFTNRSVLFDTGGKPAADILLRESSNARNWIRANVSVHASQYGTGYYVLEKKAYFLEMKTNGTSSSDMYAGNFIGDYRTGVVSIGDATSSIRSVNERVSSVQFRQGVSSGWTAQAWYVPMSG